MVTNNNVTKNEKYQKMDINLVKEYVSEKILELEKKVSEEKNKVVSLEIQAVEYRQKIALLKSQVANDRQKIATLESKANSDRKKIIVLENMVNADRQSAISRVIHNHGIGSIWEPRGIRAPLDRGKDWR